MQKHANVVLFFSFFAIFLNLSSAKIYTRCELANELYIGHKVPLSLLPDWVCTVERGTVGTMDTAYKHKGPELNHTSVNYGLFQINNEWWCADEFERPPGRNLCQTNCSNFLDDSITDDINCSLLEYREKGNSFKDRWNWETHCQGKDLSHYLQNCTVLPGRVPVINSNKEELTKTFLTNGVNQHLSCEAEGYPRPVLFWEYDKKAYADLITSPGMGMMNQENRTTLWLIFPSIRIDHMNEKENEFSCVATNAAGKTNQTFRIHIEEPTEKSDVATAIVIPVIITLVLVIVGLIIYLKFFQKNKGLTEAEIQEFHNGNQSQIREGGPIHENAKYLPYSKDYEIFPERLKLDSKNILGQGQYGMVMKGQLDGGQDVAVKSVLPKTDVSYVKSLISELKIMIYLGKHDGIVNLIGAQTSELNKGIINIVVEFCGLGDVRSYILMHKGEFIGFCQGHKYGTYENVPSSQPCLTFEDLVRWSIQIASAMDYLASRSVIHGDLAARNVLLADRTTAKISDFGLARQLYDYTNYVKKAQAPLPWRWMAIESLREMSFSTQSDVWAFGVTLWEIFSLGDVPYPGLSWSLEFVDELSKGLRLLKPTYATSEMYNVMLKCWSVNKDDRPSFKFLSEILSHELHGNQNIP